MQRGPLLIITVSKVLKLNEMKLNCETKRRNNRAFHLFVTERDSVTKISKKDFILLRVYRVLIIVFHFPTEKIRKVI